MIERLIGLAINDFFESKLMIEDIEAELAGAPKKASDTDNLAVAEEANVDEDVTAEAKASSDMEISIK